GLAARLSVRQIGRRGGRGCLRLAVLPRLSDDGAVTIVDHVAHGERLNRDGRDLRSRRRRDLRGTGETGPQFLDGVVERDLDEEVGGRLPGTRGCGPGA